MSGGRDERKFHFGWLLREVLSEKLAFEFSLEIPKEKPCDRVEWVRGKGDIPNKEKSKCRSPRRE